MSNDENRRFFIEPLFYIAAQRLGTRYEFGFGAAKIPRKYAGVAGERAVRNAVSDRMTRVS